MKNKVISLLKGVGYILVAFGVQVMVSMIYGVITMFRLISSQGIENFGGNSEEVLTLFVNTMNKDMSLILLISAILYALILALIYRIGKKKIIDDFGLKNNNMKNIIIAVFLGLSLWIIITGALTLIQVSGAMQEHFQYFEELTGTVIQGSVVITVLAVGIVVPFTEEFLFRGIIQKTLSKSMNIEVAIVIQGIFFGIYHGNLIQGLYATVLGIVYGYVTYKCKSLWPAVIMHMVNNTMAIVVSYIFPSSLNSILGYATITIIGIVIFVVSLITINKNNLEIETNKENLS